MPALNAASTTVRYALRTTSPGCKSSTLRRCFATYEPPLPDGGNDRPRTHSKSAQRLFKGFRAYPEQQRQNRPNPNLQGQQNVLDDTLSKPDLPLKAQSSPPTYHAGGSSTLSKGITLKTPPPPPPAEPSLWKPSFLNYNYDPNPKPVNSTTFQSTKSFLTDPAHPLHIKTKRKMEAFDSTILHWRVHVPTSVSKKAAIRDNAKKRIKHAFMVELKSRGFRRDGTIREGEKAGQSGLRGALLMILPSDTNRALNFTVEQAMEDVKLILDRVTHKLGRTDRGGVITKKRRDTSNRIGIF